MNLTVHCVTAGRESLRATLASISAQQLQVDDQVLLACDSRLNEMVLQLWASAQLPGKLVFLDDGPHCDWGHSPRNRTLNLATGDYIASIDDDDVLAPDALKNIRQAISRQTSQSFHMFRMSFASGKTLWRDREVRFGNVGTPMFVHPRGVRVGVYKPTYGGDFDFIADTLAMNSHLKLHWQEQIVALIRP